MADKEEVEPTEESAATESSDAATDPVAPGASTQSSGGTRAVGAGDRDDPDADEVGGVDDADEFADDDRFDAIVRDSGIGESDDPDSDDDETEKALEPAGVAAATTTAGSSTLAARKAGREAKGAATRKRDQPVKQERTGPVKFVRESVGELRKVVYPTGQQLVNYFIVVLVFVLFVIGYVSLLDLGMGWAIFKVFS